MVLWEITLGTAYFLGLKRTYRLALKIQRRLVSPKRPKIRQFLHRKTRSVFDVALKFHREVQQRDIEVGRNLGNRILRWLDKMKPTALIRGPKPTQPDGHTIKTTKTHLPDPSNRKTPHGYGSSSTRNEDRESGRHLFTSTRNTYSAMGTMMIPSKPIGTRTHYRPFGSGPNALELGNSRFGLDGAIRKDKLQWMLQN